MGGDSFLRPGHIAFPRDLSRNAILRLAQSFDHRAELLESGPEKDMLREKAQNLRVRLTQYGCGILSGFAGLVCERHPSTVFGAVKRKTIVVGDFPGAAIYIRSFEIDEAGGDFDGDLLFVFHPDDPDGELMYHHCMNSRPYLVAKTENFATVTDVAVKKNYHRTIGLLSTTWIPEKESLILQEFKEKDIIGRVWYGLMHYMYLGAHYTPEGEDRDAYLNRRLQIIRNRALQFPKGDLSGELAKFVGQIPGQWEIRTGPKGESIFWVHFHLLSPAQLYYWVHLAYVSVAEAFFPIYEIIFDIRKGEGRPPFSPNEVVSALMGYAPFVDWNGLQQADVWTEIIRDIYSCLPAPVGTEDEQSGARKPGVDMTAALRPYPAFYYLVNKRRGLTTTAMFQSTQILASWMGRDDYAGWLMSQLLLGEKDDSEETRSRLAS
jgi:hypothetical protein